MTEDGSALSRLRIDVWLDIACLFKTRSEAQKACKGGKVEVNGVRVKPHRDVQAGDEIVISRSHVRQRVIVKTVTDRHVAKALASEMYDDLTPPPSAEELELRRLLRAAPPGAGLKSPGKRDRRALRRLKGRDE